jgi:hypothetical protein
MDGFRTICHNMLCCYYRTLTVNLTRKQWNVSKTHIIDCTNYCTTALQVGRSRVRFSMVSFGFFIDIIIPRKRKANWIGHILRRNCLLQRVTERKIQGRTEVTGRQGRRRRKLLMTLRKGEDTLIWKRKLWIALCGELALEEALDQS